MAGHHPKYRVVGCVLKAQRDGVNQQETGKGGAFE